MHYVGRVANSRAYGVILTHLTCYSRTHAIDKITHAFFKNHTHIYSPNLKNKKICTIFDQIDSITLSQYFISVYKFTPVHHQQRKNIGFLKIAICRNHKSQTVVKIYF